MACPARNDIPYSPQWFILAAVCAATAGEIAGSFLFDTFFSLLPMVAGVAIAVFSWSFLGPCGASVGQRFFALVLWSMFGMIIVLWGVHGFIAIYDYCFGVLQPIDRLDGSLARTTWLRVARPAALVIQLALIVGIGVVRGRRFFTTARIGGEGATAADVPSRGLGLWGALSLFALPVSVLFSLVVGFLVYVNFETGRGYTLPQWIYIVSLLILLGGLLAACVADAKDERLWGLRVIGLLINGLALIWTFFGEALSHIWEGPG